MLASRSNLTTLRQCFLMCILRNHDDYRIMYGKCLSQDLTHWVYFYFPIKDESKEKKKRKACDVFLSCMKKCTGFSNFHSSAIVSDLGYFLMNINFKGVSIWYTEVLLLSHLSLSIECPSERICI